MIFEIQEWQQKLLGKKGYFVSTVGLNIEAVKEYIKNLEKEDMMEDNLSTKEYNDPFKG